MSKGVCASCLDFDIDKVVKSKESLKPTWLAEHDYVRSFISKQPLKLKTPLYADVVMKLELGSKFASKKILYWATERKKDSSPKPLSKDAKNAYGKFENSGVVKSDSKGNVELKLACPQLYKAKRKNQTKLTTHFRHLHFVVEKEQNWDPQIYTKIVVCKYTLKKTMEEKEKGFTVLLNALPAEYYGKDHILNSVNLHYKQISKMTKGELDNWFHEIIEIHYPKLWSFLQSKKIELYEIPIITYCAHDKCNASELALKELMKKGFVNINEFPGGMKEYRNKFSHH